MLEFTRWNCEKCGKSGVFKHTGMGVWEGAQVVKEEHNKVSPNCEFDADKVRVSLVDESTTKEPEQ